MKTIITKLLSVVACLLFVFGSNTVSAQNNALVPILSYLLEDSCGTGTTLTGDQTLTTQAQVNALTGVSIIDGSLILDPAVNLDLSPLDLLTEVSGDFKLEQDNTAQTSLSGFNCLRTVGHSLLLGGSFSNNSNTTLLSITGFSSLTFVGQSLLLVILMVNIEAFQKLSRVGFIFRFSNIAQLTSIPAFPKLSSIGLDLSINANDELLTIGGFPQLSSVGGQFKIDNNISLSSIMGFSQLFSADIGGSSTVSNNSLLDCSNPLPNFLLVDNSTANQVNCPKLFISSTSYSIPDGVVTDTITTSGTGNISNVMVNLDILHTFMWDLTVTLKYVATGTTVTLIDKPINQDTDQCSGDNINNILSDTATLFAQVDCLVGPSAYLAGVRYRPSGDLSVFNGMPIAGDWELSVTDSESGDTGTLISWSLYISE